MFPDQPEVFVLRVQIIIAADSGYYGSSVRANEVQCGRRINALRPVTLESERINVEIKLRFSISVKSNFVFTLVLVLKEKLAALFSHPT